MSKIKLKPVAEVEQELTVQVPLGRGEFSPRKLYVTYRLLPPSEMQAYMDTPTEKRPLDDELMRRDIHGVDTKSLRDVIDIDGDIDTVKTPDLVEAMLDVSYIRIPLIEGWRATQHNRAAHAEKN